MKLKAKEKAQGNDECWAVARKVIGASPAVLFSSGRNTNLHLNHVSSHTTALCVHQVTSFGKGIYGIFLAVAWEHTMLSQIWSDSWWVDDLHSNMWGSMSPTVKNDVLFSDTKHLAFKNNIRILASTLFGW